MMMNISKEVRWESLWEVWETVYLDQACQRVDWQLQHIILTAMLNEGYWREIQEVHLVRYNKTNIRIFNHDKWRRDRFIQVLRRLGSFGWWNLWLDRRWIRESRGFWMIWTEGRSYWVRKVWIRRWIVIYRTRSF